VPADRVCGDEDSVTQVERLVREARPLWLMELEELEDADVIARRSELKSAPVGVGARPSGA